MSDPRRVTRRALLGGFATFPLVALVSSPALLAACGSRPPETPLAHLYGREWVHGAYKLYSGKYADVQTSADESSQDAYRVLAQKGVVALDALQSRDVPFYARVDGGGRAFSIERKVPERLMFTAGMTDADRKAAEAAWKKARDHVHTDYEEIRRLDWALTRLLAQLQRIRNAIEEGRVEQYRLVEQLLELKKDPKGLPYELPFQVTVEDYEEILVLLVERLEDDRAHLAQIEADIIAVGMTVRATDAGSATLAASIRKVLLAVVEDSAAPARAPLFPADEGEKAKLLGAGRELVAKIEASPEFAKWRADEREKKLAAVGAFLQALDAMTGLPTSRVYRTVLDVWRGDHDYLGYLQTIVAIVPHGGKVALVINEAIEYTQKARKIAGTVMATVDTVKSAGSLSSDALVAAATAAATKEAKGLVLNTASRFAVERAEKQLSFFKDNAEIQTVTDALAQTDLVQKAMPTLPVGLPKG
ncbi:MAG: hypothetical protein KIS78_31830 [Labilithrix sp.]|nr:hypothetical protein [Labilithrix sp.]MCW5837028.1 hypothetical protein [Labilithrix sp.]